MSTVTLLDRARRVLADHRAAATALAMAVPLAATAAAQADIATFVLGGAAVQFNDGSYGGNFQTYLEAPVATVGSLPLIDGIKLVGTGLDPNSDSGTRAFTVFGGQYTGTPDASGASNQLLISGSAYFAAPFQWDSALYSLPTIFGFGVDFTGGTFAINRVGTSFVAFDPDNMPVAGVGSSGFSTEELAPGGYGFGFPYVDNFGNNPLISRIDWAVTIGFHWTGASTSDELHLNIPYNSIDIQIVPGPAAASLAGLGLLAAARRKR